MLGRKLYSLSVESKTISLTYIYYYCIIKNKKIDSFSLNGRQLNSFNQYIGSDF